jgi:hypothetical protein
MANMFVTSTEPFNVVLEDSKGSRTSSCRQAETKVFLLESIEQGKLTRGQDASGIVFLFYPWIKRTFPKTEVS